MTPSAQRLIRYGALGVLCVVAAGGAVYLLGLGGILAPAIPTVSSEPSAAAPSRQARAARRPAAPDEATTPSDADREQVLRLMGDARRLADDGKFSDALAALAKADKILPGQSEVAEARRDITASRTPQAQFATQISRARSAIEQDDAAAAQKALAEAERLSPQAPEIASLRQALQAAQQKDARRDSRIAALLATMREALSRRDFAKADGAFNEAARLDVRDPLIDRARTEIAQAHEAERK